MRKETKEVMIEDAIRTIRKDCGEDKEAADICVRELSRVCDKPPQDFGLASAAALYLALSHIGYRTRILMGQVVTNDALHPRRRRGNVGRPRSVRIPKNV